MSEPSVLKYGRYPEGAYRDKDMLVVKEKGAS